MSSDQRLTRHAVIRPEAKPLPIWSGDPPRPIEARWLAILRDTEPADGRLPSEWFGPG